MRLPTSSNVYILSSYIMTRAIDDPPQCLKVFFKWLYVGEYSFVYCTCTFKFYVAISEAFPTSTLQVYKQYTNSIQIVYKTVYK